MSTKTRRLVQVHDFCWPCASFVIVTMSALRAASEISCFDIVIFFFFWVPLLPSVWFET